MSDGFGELIEEQHHICSPATLASGVLGVDVVHLERHASICDSSLVHGLVILAVSREWPVNAPVEHRVAFASAGGRMEQLMGLLDWLAPGYTRSVLTQKHVARPQGRQE
jgi:hypothetical protein